MPDYTIVKGGESCMGWTIAGNCNWQQTHFRVDIAGVLQPMVGQLWIDFDVLFLARSIYDDSCL